MNDMDYVNFVSNEEIQQKLRENKMDERDMALTSKFPEIKIPNKFFSNQGNMQFADEADGIENDKPTYSNGAVYADLDNDGDLDIVVNNIDDAVVVYENKSNDKKDRPFEEITLKGPANNVNAVGAKLVLFANKGIRTYESFPCRGFMSTMQVPMHVGLANTRVDSAFLIWPDNTYQRLQLTANSRQTIKYSSGLPKFNYQEITSYWQNETLPVDDITQQTKLAYRHQENPFPEFDREPLMPHMVSTEGPALAVGDINHDGLEDVFLGASKTFHNAVMLQQPNGTFVRSLQPDMEKDSMYEDVDAHWVDVNNDGNLDLVVATGGNEYYGNDEHLLPRVYLNDGKAHLTKLQGAFTNLFATFSCIVPSDFNGDGKVDLFLGGRALSWAYGEIPPSYLLQNDGTGRFVDVTKKYAPELATEGMVTQAIWYDIDGDGDKDLIVCCEWGGIDAFINNKGYFTKKPLTDKKGWWNFILPVDVNGDGKVDLIAGNLGLNSRLKASSQQPVRLYYNDFDDNGKKEQILTYFLNGREIPFANKDEIQRQIPLIKKKFLYAGDFAQASLSDIFSSSKLESATVFTADYFSNAVLINKGNGNFETKALPWEAQLAPYRDAIVVDANNDDRPDILLVGNYYESNIQMGRYDADFGTLLVNRGNGNFVCSTLNGLSIKGQVRHIQPLTIKNQPALILARNNDSAMIIRFRK
jgi:enediyne biosynthesis protein E4